MSAKTHKPPLTFWPLFIRAGLLSLLFTAIMLAITAVGLGIWGYSQFRQFTQVADITADNFMSQVRTGWQQSPTTTDGYKNVLILGTDSTSDRGDIPALTDTMMVLSINSEKGVINTLPLPRDLWNEAYQTKINALYAYGLDRYPNTPEQFAAEVITEMTEVPIHHTFVLSLAQLKELIDLAGGVEINIEQGFTDPLYPREGVDVTTVTDPELLYQTVTFEAGSQSLSGEQALQYIRSRHSEDEQGHDLARGARQQQVIEALLTKLTNYKLLVTQPELAGKLFRFYDDYFSTALPLSEFVSTGKSLIPHRRSLSFTSHQLEDIDDNPAEGVIDNPPRSTDYQYQWVYVITDQQQFSQVVQEKLFSE